MDKGTASLYMKSRWNSRAQKDAFFYVETSTWTGDVAEFFRDGEDRTQILIDPALNELDLHPESKIALDIGCGVGRFTRSLGNRFKKVIGVDVSGEMIEKANKLHNPDEFPNLEFREGDGITLPIIANSIDFVWSYEVFQHMPSHGVISDNLKEISRVLRTGGSGLLHFNKFFRRFDVAQLYRDHVPDSLDRLIRRMTKKDSLMADAAFRGAPPFSSQQIRTACSEVGLNVLRFYDDPTHDPETRIFALVDKMVSPAIL